MHSRTDDIVASVVVFLVALPLCMGISIASGVPPALGLITGIIGGILVGALAGAPLQVSGPAAGLTVLVADIVRDHGIAALGPVVLIAGLLQLLAGRLRVGTWFRAMSPAVVYGMLAGIGVLIFASQFHVMLDDKPRSSGIENLISIPGAIVGGIFPADGSSHELAAVLGLVTIICLVAWDKLKRGRARLIPGALVGIITASGIAFVFRLPVQYVTVPSNLLDAVTLPDLGSLAVFTDTGVLLAAVALAFIASAETLLSAAAVDRMQTLYRTDYDRELSAQGLGNMLCGLLGALPMTGVIVRSSANVLAGATTRLSAVLHGVYLLAFVAILPDVLRAIPTSALGGILVFTGYKLVDVNAVRTLRSYGRWPVLIYASTLVGIVCTDLLTGVFIGIGLTIANLLYKVTHLEVAIADEDGILQVRLIGAATVVRLPKLASALESIPSGTRVVIHVERVAYIDHSCLDLISGWRSQFEEKGGTVALEWDDLRSRFTPIHNSPVLNGQKAAEPVSETPH